MLLYQLLGLYHKDADRKPLLLPFFPLMFLTTLTLLQRDSCLKRFMDPLS